MVTVNLLLNDTTYNTINKTYLNMIRKDTIVVKIGRKVIINESEYANKINQVKAYFIGLLFRERAN